MAEKKFLQQIADYYIGKDTDMSGLTMVFPNRRSAMFMRRYMQQTLKNTAFMPRMMSITYFTQKYNDTQLATPAELVLLLYKAYCRVLIAHGKESQIPDFDNFYYWGSILLNDFNDADAYLADARELFTNIKRIREMKAHYLTPEQKEVIEFLWGDKLPADYNDKFWDHITHPGEPDADAPMQKFLNLWEILYEIYQEFHSGLAMQNPPLAYSGMQSRCAYDKIKAMEKDDFRGRRFAFVGFNVLSHARVQIFRKFQQMGIADFFWDVASPHLVEPDGSPSAAGKLIIPLSRRFKAPADFELLAPEGKQDIEIISVPSNVGQAKVASEILKQWTSPGPEESPIDESRLLETSVVMADEGLLMPMLYSIPPTVSKINVTMGVSYRSTPFAALMSAIISMHLRAYKIREAYHFFYQDVVEVLSHPHITCIAPDDSEEIRSRIVKEHLYQVNAEELISGYPSLAFLFTPVTEETDISRVREYIESVISNLQKRLLQKPGIESAINQFYEFDILQGYTQEVDALCRLIEKHGVGIREHTFLQMIERTLQNKPVSFAGEPLKGLQLMGVMDTRALDFDNLIMLSLNERVFPKRNYNPSLVPMALRAAYSLPTQEHEESSYAYQFYRLISRASRVRLLYDSRTAGISSGERSRYLSQLVYMNPRIPVSTRGVELNAEVETAKEISIKKTPQVMEELQGFFPGGNLRLSASALKTYIECPLRFYLEYVKRLRPYDETVEYIDAASYGTVTHRVVQELYKPYGPKASSPFEHTLITPQVIDRMLKVDIEFLARRVLDKEYYKGRYSKNLNHMPGEGKVYARLIAKYARKMLELEREAAMTRPYYFEANEYGEGILFRWRVNDKYTINFKMSIDRMDSMRHGDNGSETALRFIDFKTGSDELSSKDMAALFTNHKKSAIFQLLLYCHAYAALFGYSGPIHPIIYKLQKISTDGIVNLRLGGKPILDYRDLRGWGFMSHFEAMLDEIFSPETEFRQTPDEKECLYCSFKQICGRYPEKKTRH